MAEWSWRQPPLVRGVHMEPSTPRRPRSRTSSMWSKPPPRLRCEGGPGPSVPASWAARGVVIGGVEGRRSAGGSRATRYRALRPSSRTSCQIHLTPPDRLPFLGSKNIPAVEGELDSVGDPHPAIEYGLWWLREHGLPPPPGRGHARRFLIGRRRPRRAGSRTYRLGGRTPLRPAAISLSRSSARAWRHGGGSGASARPGHDLERYAELTGRALSPRRSSTGMEVLGVVMGRRDVPLHGCHLTGLDLVVDVRRARANGRRDGSTSSSI